MEGVNYKFFSLLCIRNKIQQKIFWSLWTVTGGGDKLQIIILTSGTKSSKKKIVVCRLLPGGNYKSSFHKLQKNILLDFVPDVKMTICSLPPPPATVHKLQKKFVPLPPSDSPQTTFFFLLDFVPDVIMMICSYAPPPPILTASAVNVFLLKL